MLPGAPAACFAEYTMILRNSPILAAVLAAFSMSAHAALGGQPTLPSTAGTSSTGVSVDASTNASYTVRQETLTNGTVEREYLTSGGEVFGISWNGPYKPDLQDFMGSDIFSEYGAALQAANVRGSHSVTFDGVVVQEVGHMGHFVGRAYVIDLLPSGIDTSVIQ
jgi:hypothetical protein